MIIKPIQNTNNNLVSPSLQNRLNSVDVKAVAAPTPVIPGAPVETNGTQNQDSVEISTKKKKKFDSTLLLAFIIGGAISIIVPLISRKIMKH